ncbi:hypothetical protein WJX73_003441 [Symbiochloris irregularis]|uniref:mannan endo-1,4-beta-mannosidase n=1 Tax=Symbiochloris irregularis TaxID=706552 RepID=A0AAW1Q436_9CHLO
MATWGVVVSLIAASVLFSGVHAQVAGQQSQQHGFIRVSGQNFVDDQCNDFTFSGYNTWEAIEAAANTCCGGRAGLNEQLQTAVANNFTVVRMFGFAVEEGVNLQTAPGVYNESLFRAFDYVVARAGQLGLKLIPALANNWHYNSNSTDNKCWYVNHTENAEECDEFWTNPETIQMYKNHAHAVMTRNNSITGVRYGQDPTFFAWDLINEGRCESANCTAADLQSWTEEVAPYVKNLTRSLLTIGQEGFYQAANCHANNVNPAPNSDKWVLATGQDFLPNHMARGIDYASIHLWPDNWARTDDPFGYGWLYAHMEDAQTAGKPLVLEEFGKASAPFSTDNNQYGVDATPLSQEQYYKIVYAIAEASMNDDPSTPWTSSLKGIALWRWDAVDSGGLSSKDEALTLNSSSEAFTNVVLPFSQRVKARSQSSHPVRGCTPIRPANASSAAGPSISVSSISNAGRRLAQASQHRDQSVAQPPSHPVPTAANINAAVTNCSAYSVYSLAGSQ